MNSARQGRAVEDAGPYGSGGTGRPQGPPLRDVLPSQGSTKPKQRPASPVHTPNGLPFRPVGERRKERSGTDAARFTGGVVERSCFRRGRGFHVPGYR